MKALCFDHSAALFGLVLSIAATSLALPMSRAGAIEYDFVTIYSVPEEPVGRLYIDPSNREVAGAGSFFDFEPGRWTPWDISGALVVGDPPTAVEWSGLIPAPPPGHIGSSPGLIFQLWLDPYQPLQDFRVTLGPVPPEASGKGYWVSVPDSGNTLMTLALAMAALGVAGRWCEGLASRPGYETIGSTVRGRFLNT